MEMEVGQEKKKEEKADLAVVVLLLFSRQLKSRSPLPL
jgi:hypothetical protein